MTVMAVSSPWVRECHCDPCLLTDAVWLDSCPWFPCAAVIRDTLPLCKWTIGWIGPWSHVRFLNCEQAWCEFDGTGTGNGCSHSTRKWCKTASSTVYMLIDFFNGTTGKIVYINFLRTSMMWLWWGEQNRKWMQSQPQEVIHEVPKHSLHINRSSVNYVFVRYRSSLFGYKLGLLPNNRFFD